MRLLSTTLGSWVLVCLLVSVLTGLQPGLAHANTATAQQDIDELVSYVSEFLHQQADAYPGEASIQIEAPRQDKLTACDAMQAFLTSGQRLRSRLTVGVRCLGPTPWTTRVQAHMAIHGFFYVASRDLSPGDTVSLDHLIAREADILSLARSALVDPSQIIDQVVTQRIPAGTPFKANALRSPLAIQRGQMVRTEAHGPGFIATGQGRSLDTGGPGEQIRVRTPSGQIISGTVHDAQTVYVLM